MMDPVSRLDTENAGTQTGIARKFLKRKQKTHNNLPVR